MKKKLAFIVFIIIMVFLFIFCIVFAVYAKQYIFYNKYDLDNKITISQSARTFYNSVYNPNTEFARCLDIEIYGNSYIQYNILSSDNVLWGNYDSNSFNEYCEYGMIHSHPEGECVFSLNDIQAFKDGIKKGEVFSVIICGKDKFYYITRNNFEERKIEI